MGQTINHISVASMTKEALTNLTKNADKFLLKKRFKLGEGECPFNQKDSSLLYDIIETNRCEIFDDINKVIREGASCIYQVELDIPNEDSVLTSLRKANNGSTSKDTLYSLWLSRGNSGTMDSFLDLLLEDEKVEWAEINW